MIQLWSEKLRGKIRSSFCVRAQFPASGCHQPILDQNFIKTGVKLVLAIASLNMF